MSTATRLYSTPRRRLSDRERVIWSGSTPAGRTRDQHKAADLVRRTEAWSTGGPFTLPGLFPNHIDPTHNNLAVLDMDALHFGKTGADPSILPFHTNLARAVFARDLGDFAFNAGWPA